jgi:O-antigen/teichoic acid export membrane protein
MHFLQSLLDKLPISKKLASDSMWNMAGFGIMGIIGIVLNILIAKYYNAAVLGVFNQTYSIYILFSQFAVFGIHLSVLHNVARYRDDTALVGEILTSALVAISVIASLVTIVFYFSRDFFGNLLDSQNVSASIIYTLPGLFLFAFNKTLLAYHNATRKMKAYAIFQTFRSLFMLATLVIIIRLNLNGVMVSGIFTGSEFLLLVMILAVSMKHMKLRISRKTASWIRRHLRFGYRAAVGNILGDVNTRVDALMLGIFASDRIVGIYSFASMLAEGFNQLPIVFRTNVNPIITNYRYNRDKAELENALNKGKWLFYKLLTPMGIIAIFSFPVIIAIFGFNEELASGWSVFTVLILGIMLSAGYLPFQMLFNQIGHPGHQTLLISLIFLTNVVLNAALIPPFGMYGAAVATAAAFVSKVFYIKFLALRVADISI